MTKFIYLHFYQYNKNEKSPLRIYAYVNKIRMFVYI